MVEQCISEKNSLHLGKEEEIKLPDKNCQINKYKT